jgi:hypothetical protein
VQLLGERVSYLAPQRVASGYFDLTKGVAKSHAGVSKTDESSNLCQTNRNLDESVVTLVDHLAAGSIWPWRSKAIRSLQRNTTSLAPRDTNVACPAFVARRSTFNCDYGDRLTHFMQPQASA